MSGDVRSRLDSVSMIERFFEDSATLRRFLQYLLVGVVGIGINEGILFLTTGVFGASYVLGGILGRVTSIGANYLMNDSWTWRHRGQKGFRGFAKRGGKYILTRVVGVIIGLTTLVGLVEMLQLHYLIANLVAIGVGVAWGFTVSDRWVWPSSAASLAPTDSQIDRYLPRRVRNAVPDLSIETWYVIGIAGVMFISFSIYTSALYLGYWSTGSDFGSYVHMFSTTLKGEGFLQHGKYRISHPFGSYWGAHFSLTLLLFFPIFALVPSPVTLLVLKSLVIAGSIPVLWLIARHHIANDRIAGLIVASYALNPFLWSAWIFDFQEQALLPLLVFGTYYAYENRRYRVFLGLYTLVLLTNEFAVIIMAGALIGLCIASARAGRLRSERRVFTGAILATVFVKLLSGLVIANFSRFSGIPDASIATPIVRLIEGPRIGMGELLLTVASNPTVLVDTFGIDPMLKILFFVVLLVPVAFLALYDEIAVFALIPFVGFAWFLSGRPLYYQFGAHYPLYLLPFIYIGAVRVLGRTLDLSPLAGGGRPTRFLSRIFVMILVLNLVAGVSVGLEKNAVPQLDDHSATLDQAIESIPPDATLLTQNDIYPHVASRSGATYVVRPDMFDRYQTAYGTVSPEYLLFDTRLTARPIDWSRAVTESFDGRLGQEYGLVRYENGIYVFQRGFEGQPAGITRPFSIDKHFSPDDFQLSKASRTNGVIQGSGPAATRNVWFGPYTDLPPGTYDATFSVNATRFEDGPGDTPIAELSVAVDGGKRVLAHRPVNATGGWTEVTLRFTLEQYRRDIEFRGARAGGSGRISMDHVRIEDVSDVNTRYSINDLAITDGRIDGGRIHAAARGSDSNVWFGPFANLPQGTYTVTYRIDVDANGSEPVLLLNVARSDGKTVLVTKSITETDGWQNITLTVELSSPASDVEFRGARVGGEGRISLEWIEVERTDGATGQ